MKGSNRIGFLLVAAAAALFLPACGGGGGDGQDYYTVSPEQFAAGGKEFKIFGLEQCEIYADPGATRYPASDGKEGFIVQGWVKMGGGTSVASANIEYYADYSAGEPTAGHMIISFVQEPSTAVARSIVHMMGGVVQEDVQHDGTITADFVTAGEDRKRMLVVSPNAIRLKMDFNFKDGTCTVTLQWWTDEKQGLDDIVTTTLSYVAPPVGS